MVPEVVPCGEAHGGVGGLRPEHHPGQSTLCARLLWRLPEYGEAWLNVFFLMRLRKTWRKQGYAAEAYDLQLDGCHDITSVTGFVQLFTMALQWPGLVKMN